VRVKGVSQTTNAIIHPWLKDQVSQILATLPEPTQVLSPEENRAWWESWREGLTQKVTLIEDLPPLRMLLIWDNIVGHTNAELLCWLFRQGVLPICTPLGGSWPEHWQNRSSICLKPALWEDNIPKRPKRS
jgi:hypothetical protein